MAKHRGVGYTEEVPMVAQGWPQFSSSPEDIVHFRNLEFICQHAMSRGKGEPWI